MVIGTLVAVWVTERRWRDVAAHTDRSHIAARAVVVSSILVLSVAGVGGEAARASVDDVVTPVPASTTIPAGCPLPPTATAVFVGKVVASDVRTARFQVGQIRAGTLEGHEVNGLVDVDYEDEVRFLETGETYLVGVSTNSVTDRLSSAVREPAPLFGGNQVAGLDDVSSECPTFEDPVRTLMPDGTPVESGVVAPLLEKRRELLGSLVLPALWVFLGLVAVAAVKNLLWASGREIGTLFSRRRSSRSSRFGP